MMKHERGVALLQALLLSMIVSLLALQLTLTARDQIETVRLLEERLQADLLTHSLEMEALFNLLTVEDQAPSFKGVWSTTAEAGASSQTFAPAAGVTVTVSDLSGRLPLRYPEHPLWRGTLVKLGMPTAQVDGFLSTLGKLQGNERSGRMKGQTLNTSNSFEAYPNRYLQLANEAEYWLGDLNGWMPLIRKISHHYPLAEVNQGALAETLQQAAVMLSSGRGVRPSGKGGTWSADVNSDARNSRALSRGAVSPLTSRSLQNSELVTNLNSNYWQVEVVVETPELIRRVKTDFLLQSLDSAPFLMIGR